MTRSTRKRGGAPGTYARRASGVSNSRRPQGRLRASSTRDSSRPGSGVIGRGTYVGRASRFTPSSTKRLAVLAAIVVVLMLMLIPTLRGFLSQRAQIAALEGEVATREANIARLDHELTQWEDPVYVEQQARDRLKFVRPGETRYQVLGAEGLTGAELADSGSVVRPGPGGDHAWYNRVWDSLDAADSLSPKDVNAPLAPISPGATADENGDAVNSGGSSGTTVTGNSSSDSHSISELPSRSEQSGGIADVPRTGDGSGGTDDGTAPTESGSESEAGSGSASAQP